MRTVIKSEVATRDMGFDATRRQRIPFRFHPRALAALGQDLVTNDSVAVMELVKNAYDAMATKVVIRVRPSSGVPGGGHIEIADDGHGMNYDTIVNVWSVVATPFRRVAATGRGARTITGDKGLGRLSAARLGRRLQLTTRAVGGPVLRVAVDWEEARLARDMDDASFHLSTVPVSEFECPHGTVLRIDLLNGAWGADDVEDLREHLARLVSPFAGAEDFRVFLDEGRDGARSETEIKPPSFLAESVYAIKGAVAADGSIRAQYRHRPLGGKTGRTSELRKEWRDPTGAVAGSRACGPFTFEIRAWDLTRNDTRDIAHHFREAQDRFRGAIRSHRGVSVYRDDMLVLPKSNGARDWLGIDQREDGAVAPCLSTSQIVGHVRITKADNPDIVDASDREGLVSNPAATAFRQTILRVIALLEAERHADRIPEADEVVATSLFADLSTDALVAKLERLRDNGGAITDGIGEVKAFGRRLGRTRAALERRFGYYRRLAVVGTLSRSIIREIRNTTSAIRSVLRGARALADSSQDAETGQSIQRADSSARALDRLAGGLAPLAHRGYEADDRTAVVEESIDRCLATFARSIRRRGIAVHCPPRARTEVRIDPGELDAVFLNLFNNALQWLWRCDEQTLRVVLTREPDTDRVTIRIDDSGPGVHPSDQDRVFWPGVTRRPGGTGMGLTVASELVRGRGGKMTCVVPGRLGGATFEFDLPLAGRAPQPEETPAAQLATRAAAPPTDVRSGPTAARRIPFRFHPRALAALGQELVTNDSVAVMELVKNAYDAMATEVVVRIRSEIGRPEEAYLEVSDNGHGMDHETIVNVWSVVATPFRRQNSVAEKGRRARSIAGQKGLGRLSAARLGRRLKLITRAPGGAVLRVAVDWERARRADAPDDAGFDLSHAPEGEFGGAHGTVLRIGSLNSAWGAEEIDILRQHLARLVSPFAGAEEFRVFLDVGQDSSESVVGVEAPAFMAEPKYAIKGVMAADGSIRARYRHRPLDGTAGDARELRELRRAPSGSAAEPPQCGPFEFDIRAWDLTAEDERDIARRFGVAQSRVPGAIRSHRGVSVYRDDILVLPKSTGARDWPGIDQRDADAVAHRLSASQIVGRVRITKADNPGIVDTSDREGLVSNPASTSFRHMILRIIGLLEAERQVDRIPELDKVVAASLFADLETDALVARLETIRGAGGALEDGIVEVEAFGQRLSRSRAAIERRFGYYNRLAVIGTISQFVIHQIGGATMVMGSALRRTRALANRVRDGSARRSFQSADGMVHALYELGARFVPLAHRSYDANDRTSVVEESVDCCLAMFAEPIRRRGVAVQQPSRARTEVQVDPGELDAVLHVLLANALYWLTRCDNEQRIRVALTDGPASNRVTIRVDDSGPGIHPDDRDRVFWPGVTRKPGGTGMGLALALELVQGRGGRITTTTPGGLGGATFAFDLPLAGDNTNQ